MGVEEFVDFVGFELIVVSCNGRVVVGGWSCWWCRICWEFCFSAAVSPYGEAVHKPRMSVDASAWEGTMVGLQGCAEEFFASKMLVSVGFLLVEVIFGDDLILSFNSG